MIADVVSTAPKDQPEEDRDARAEDEEPDQLPQQCRRRRLSPETERDVEEEVIQETCQDQRPGDADRERAVVPVLPDVDRRDPQSREQRDAAKDEEGEGEGPGQSPDDERKALLERRDRFHRQTIRSRTARGWAASWKRRTPATPAIRSL
jgi:hypothetical protein